MPAIPKIASRGYGLCLRGSYPSVEPSLAGEPPVKHSGDEQQDAYTGTDTATTDKDQVGPVDAQGDGVGGGVSGSGRRARYPNRPRDSCDSDHPRPARVQKDRRLERCQALGRSRAQGTYRELPVAACTLTGPSSSEGKNQGRQTRRQDLAPRTSRRDRQRARAKREQKAGPGALLNGHCAHNHSGHGLATLASSLPSLGTTGSHPGSSRIRGSPCSTRGRA